MIFPPISTSQLSTFLTRLLATQNVLTLSLPVGSGCLVVDGPSADEVKSNEIGDHRRCQAGDTYLLMRHDSRRDVTGKDEVGCKEYERRAPRCVERGTEDVESGSSEE